VKRIYRANTGLPTYLVKKTVILRKAGGLLLTHVNVKSELILSSKPCTNFRGGYVYNRNYSSKFGVSGKAKKTK